VDTLEFYSLRSTHEILKRTWDDECVVYREDARETHLLTAPCAYVLGLLERGPVSLAVLRNELYQFLNGAEEADIANLLSEIVGTLSKIGLIETRGDVS
jgi:PqqD family protein of HPr-rel-A system